MLEYAADSSWDDTTKDYSARVKMEATIYLDSTLDI